MDLLDFYGLEERNSKMTEEELERQIQSYNVGQASLSHIEHGRSARDKTALGKLTCEHQRKIGSIFQFQFPQKWRQTRGEGVKIALLGTGVNLNHPDLVDSIADSIDFTGQGVDDLHGHSTHSAGILSANSIDHGLVGIAPDSKLLIGKVMTNQGSGNFSIIADGVDWAVDSGAHIISMSMYGLGSSPILYRSIAYALAKGVHIICSAENYAGSAKTENWPARYGGAIAVAPHKLIDNSDLAHKPDLRAPGHDMWSTYKKGSYQKMTGASVATAFVTGIAALIVSSHLSSRYSKTPIFNCEDLRAHLFAITTDAARHQSGKETQIPTPFLALGH